MLGTRKFILLACVLLATLFGVGFVHGLWTDRWSALNTTAEILELEKMPLTVGDWEGKTVQEDANRQILPDALNYLLRRYVNYKDGTVASVLLTRGRPGPMVIKHLPTECYPSNGYELVGQPKRFLSQAPGAREPDEFWVATFKKTNEVVPYSVRVYWSWSATGQWQTPVQPRLTFAPYSTLYRMYVVRTLAKEDEEFEGAPVHDLIKELTTSLRGSLFASNTP